MHGNIKPIGLDGRMDLVGIRRVPMDEVAGLNNRSPTSADATVGGRIKELRRAAGHTQKQVANLIGVTGAQFHRYETGATRVAASRLMAIAAALGTRPEALIGAMGKAQPMITAAPLDGAATDGLVELVEVYATISDPRRRHALIAFARVVARAQGSDDPVAD
ncbi:MAG: hypothetical protein JWR10_520 [Rubritepida sp.]|nr:hypothetical protein [Rubritepida sp.]